jgi:hypothetical protein
VAPGQDLDISLFATEAPAASRDVQPAPSLRAGGR